MRLAVLALLSACSSGQAIVACADGNTAAPGEACATRTPDCPPGQVLGTDGCATVTGGTTPTDTTTTPSDTPPSSLDMVSYWTLSTSGFAWDPDDGMVVGVRSEGTPIDPTLVVALLDGSYEVLCAFSLVRAGPLAPAEGSWTRGTALAMEWTGDHLSEETCSPVLGDDGWGAIAAALPSQTFGLAVRPSPTALGLEVYNEAYPGLESIAVGLSWYHSGLVGGDRADGVIADGTGFAFAVDEGDVVFRDDGTAQVLTAGDIVGRDVLPSAWYQLMLPTWTILDPTLLWTRR